MKKSNNPVVKIVVDGTNLAKDQNIEGEVPEAKRFCIQIEQLCVEYDIEHVEIFVSAKLKHEIDNIDIIQNLQRDGILMVTPAARDDDYFTLKHAFESDAWILSNDRYRNWKAKDREMKLWLHKKRITFVWHKLDQRFTFGHNIDRLN